MTHVVYMLHTHRLSLIHRPLARPLFIKMYRFCIRLKSTYKPFQETYLHMWHSGPFVNNEAKKYEFTSQNARGVTIPALRGRVKMHPLQPSVTIQAR